MRVSCRKIYILRPNRHQLRKIIEKLQDLRQRLLQLMQLVERWSRDAGSRVQFPAGGFGVAFFATGPGWVLKCIFFWHSNLPYFKIYLLSRKPHVMIMTMRSDVARTSLREILSTVSPSPIVQVRKLWWRTSVVLMYALRRSFLWQMLAYESLA